PATCRARTSGTAQRTAHRIERVQAVGQGERIVRIRAPQAFEPGARHADREEPGGAAGSSASARPRLGAGPSRGGPPPATPRASADSRAGGGGGMSLSYAAL